MERIHELQRQADGSWAVVKACNRHAESPTRPRNITANIKQYRPFDEYNEQVMKPTNQLGWKLPEFTLKSGQVHAWHEDKRIIFEVSCDSVIFLKISAGAPDNYNFFIQDLNSFAYDITNGELAYQVAKQTSFIKTIVKYEMYFIMGVISAASIPALIMVVGSDILVSSAQAKSKMVSSKDLVETILNERERIKELAPTLHEKIEQFVLSQLKVDGDTLAANTLERIANDEKTRGQLAGALAGKATVSPKPFTAWSAIFTLLCTGFIKSAVNLPEGYVESVKNKHKPLVDEIEKIDWSNPKSAVGVTAQLLEMFRNSGVTVTSDEALAIVSEVKSNPSKLKDSFEKIITSFAVFNREVSGGLL